MNGSDARPRLLLRPRLAILHTVLAVGAVSSGCALAASATTPALLRTPALLGLLLYVILARRAVYLWSPDFDEIVWSGGGGPRRPDPEDREDLLGGSRRIRRAVLATGRGPAPAPPAAPPGDRGVGSAAFRPDGPGVGASRAAAAPSFGLPSPRFPSFTRPGLAGLRRHA